MPKRDVAASTDPFGCQHGSNPARANLVLIEATGFMTMPAICAEAGIDGTVSDHLHRLVERGYAIEDKSTHPKTFYLTKAGRRLVTQHLEAQSEEIGRLRSRVQELE